MNIPSFLIRKLLIQTVVKSVGSGSFIAMGVDFRGRSGNISIGTHSIINKRVILDGRGGELKIGNNVDIGEETNIWTLEHDPHDDYHRVKGGSVIIEDFVWIATRVTVLPGVTIGRGSVVAANSVVTKDVPPQTIVGGIPAKIIGQRGSELKYTLTYRPWFL